MPRKKLTPADGQDEVPAAGTEVEKIIDTPPAQRMGLYESAEAQLDAEKIEAWRPDKTDPERVFGEVLAIDLAVTVDGATCPIILTLNTREVGLRRIWCWHTVLLREVIEARPQIGDVVGFAYRGRMKASSGREYVSYSVAVAREDSSTLQEVDYTRLALEAADTFADQEPEPRVELPAVEAAGGSGPNDGIPFAPSVM